EIIEHIDKIIGNMTEISGIPNGCATLIEAERGAFDRPMRHLAGIDANTGEHLQAVQRVERYDRRIAVLAREDIAEALAQAPHRFIGGEARDRPAAAIADGTQVIDTVAMIGMIMRPEHGIKPVD